MIVLRFFTVGIAATALLTGFGDTTEPSASSSGTSGQGGGGGHGGHGGDGGHGSSTSSSGSGSSGQGGSGGQGGGETQAWTAPACAAIEGTAAVTFTLDEGAALTPTAQSLQGIGYTFGLVALDAPNTLLAEHQGQILRSTDAGCVWTEIGAVEDAPLTLSAAPGGIAYAYKDNNALLYRIEGTTVSKLIAPVENALGLGAEPGKGTHLRLGDSYGGLWDSTDSGASWTPHGVQAPVGSGPRAYRYAFDPHALDHVVVGCDGSGAHVSTDGGMTWKTSTGLGTHLVNVFSVVVAPGDGNVVWAQGIDFDHDGETGFHGRTIWRSTDGGLSFTPVVTQTAGITIRNQELLAAHPTDPNVLYFVYGTHFQNYGTDIYRYDQTTDKVTKTHNDYNDVSALAFSPADAKVMYLGLTSVAGN